MIGRLLCKLGLHKLSCVLSDYHYFHISNFINTYIRCVRCKKLIFIEQDTFN